MLLPPPLPRDILDRSYLCHRGVDPALVTEIADFYREEGTEVIVQDGDGLALSWPQFRAVAWQHLEAGCDSLIVLLSENFPGPVYRHTLGRLERQAREAGKGYSFVVRVDDCEGVEWLFYADLAGATTPEERRKALIAGEGRPIC